MRDLLVKLSLGGLGARHAPPGSIGLLIVAHSRQKKIEELYVNIARVSAKL